MSANTPEGKDGAPPSLPDDLTFWSISPAPVGEDRGSAQHCADQSPENSVAEDPFGFRGTTAFGDAVERMERDIDRRRHSRNYSFPCAACPKGLVAVFRGVAHALSATPKAIGWNADGVAHVADAQADNNDDYDDHDKDDDDEEEPGSLRAAGMTKSWTRTELVFCYTLLVLLSNLLHLYAVLSPFAVRNALDEYSCGPDGWAIELARLLVRTTGIPAYMIFAKLVNSYSRPWSLFFGSLVCACGLTLAVTSTQLAIYTLGIAAAELGKNGLLVVTSVAVADSADLVPRPFFLWCLHCTAAVSVGFSPWIHSRMDHWGNDLSKNWRNATWVYFGGLTLFAIPNVLAFFIFIRRAAERGYIHQTRRHYSWNIFSPKSMLKNLNRFDTRNDFWGLAAWSMGTVSLTLGMTISPTQQLGAARHFLTCVGLGVLCNFALWESYLNRRNARQRQTDDPKDSPPPPGSPSIISFIVVQNNNDVSAELDARAALTATRLRRMRRRKQRGQVYNPLLSQSLFAATSQLTVCSFCAALESVSRALGTWIVRDAPVLYAEPNWKHWYLCVNLGCSTAGGLAAGLCIMHLKRLKMVIALGLLIELISGVAIVGACFLEPVPMDGIYLPQILHSLGSGMVDIPLLVAAHASCRKRADVATATGFLASVKGISLLLTPAACEAVLKHFGPVAVLDALRPTEYYPSEMGGYSVRAVWRFLTVANVVVMAVNFSATVVGMRDIYEKEYLPSAQQHATGVVFGRERRREPAPTPPYAVVGALVDSVLSTVRAGGP